MESETCPVPRTELDYLAIQHRPSVSLSNLSRLLQAFKRRFFSAHVNRSADCFRIGQLYEHNRGFQRLQGVKREVSVDKSCWNYETLFSVI